MRARHAVHGRTIICGGGTFNLDQCCSCGEGRLLPTKAVDETLIEIEEAQAALRVSIARARGLTEETERLVLKHRAEPAKPPNPAG